MKNLLAGMLMGALALVVTPVFAGENPQQTKMKECNIKAADKKGDERKAFMKTCLSAKPVKTESKISMCNKKTAGLKGDERAKAQSECMKA